MKGEELILNGYQRFESFESAFRRLTGDTLKPNKITVTEGTIIDFIKKNMER